MTTFKYENVTQAEIVAMTTGLLDGGGIVTVFDPAPDAPPHEEDWIIGGHGIKANAVYEPTTQELTVNILSKPFIVPVSMIDAKIKASLGRK